MAELKKIALLDNVIQARRVEGALNNREIPHVIRSYHDSALDGLFQASRGWGHIEAEAAYRERILEVLRDLESEPEEDEPTA